MEIRHLRTVIALAEELHFGHTAKRLRVAQSAVSQTIKAVESELGAELFARTKRSVQLTPAGQQFVADVRAILDDLARAAARARGAASGETGRLTLRFTLMSALTDAPLAIARYRRRFSSVRVEIEPASSADQLDALRAGRCDIGLMALAAAKDDLAPLAFKVIAHAAMVAVLPARHRLAARGSIRLQDLAGEPFVFLGQADEPQIGALFRRRCNAAGFEPDVIMEVKHADELLAFVAAGFGVSCAPDLIERLRYRGVVTVKLRPVFHGGIIAVWHPERISAPGRRFLELLDERRR